MNEPLRRCHTALEGNRSYAGAARISQAEISTHGQSGKVGHSGFVLAAHSLMGHREVSYAVSRK